MRSTTAYDDQYAPDPTSDLTLQTLVDVQAGIPARDAEIAALRKEIETLRAQQPVSGADLPEGWREQFKTELYERYCAMDNQDFPLEDYPSVALEVLGKVTGPRHPAVVAWRNDAIKACIDIAYKYCRDPDSFQYLKKDLQALMTAFPESQQPVSGAEGFDAWLKRNYPWLYPIGDGVEIAREAWRAALAQKEAREVTKTHEVL